jgi:phosphate-selective porin OprO/OprP
LQGEFIDSNVSENSGNDLNFFGFYGAATLFLTGESRPYDPATGEFRRIVPLHNFQLGRSGGWGAVMVGARFSYTDLDSGDIHGGRMRLLMGEMNWYLHPHIRWMFNAGAGHVDDTGHDGNLFIFQTRIGVDF